MSLQIPGRTRGSNQATAKAVILVGGPSRGTRFRPLSLDCPRVSNIDTRTSVVY